MLLLSGGSLVVSLVPTPSRRPVRFEPLAARQSCARVGGDVWSPLPGVDYTGLLLVDLPPNARGGMQLIVGDAIPLDIEARSATGPFPFDRERLKPALGIGIPADLWLEAGGPWMLPREVVRLTLTARRDRAEAVEVALGRRAPRVLARLDGYPADARTHVCAGQPNRRPLPPGGALDIPAREADYFATGWAADASGEGADFVRWMSGSGALLVPSAESGAVSILLRASAHPPTASTSAVVVRVNDVWDGTPLPIQADSAEYAWKVPAEAWVKGTNEILFTVTEDGRREMLATTRRTLGVHAIRVASFVGTAR